ncbi:MAG: phage tail tube protein [Lachnospiraceae bacterium]|nr:phage tail tube protein [Lachnospiraceae bacterium]
MGASYSPEKVMNGSFASMWVDSTFLGEGTELEAKISLEKKEVKQAGTLAKGYKIVGTDGKGKLKVNKISSYFIDLIAGNIKNGKTTTVQIKSTIEDPDLGGAKETVLLKGVQFDELTLINWKVKELIEEEYSFTFNDFDIMDKVEHADQGA